MTKRRKPQRGAAQAPPEAPQERSARCEHAAGVLIGWGYVHALRAIRLSQGDVRARFDAEGRPRPAWCEDRVRNLLDATVTEMLDSMEMDEATAKRIVEEDVSQYQPGSSRKQ